MSADEASVPEAPNPIVQMLGQHWSVVPTGFGWVGANGPEGKIHILVLETPVGRLGFAFNDEDLAELIRQGQQRVTGLVLPRPGEVRLN